ncbi:MAG: hypothetical protein HY809_05895 [Nitrospirae bacterium]|nr:hypothetical protein [Nitrospirota bacterium]
MVKKSISPAGTSSPNKVFGVRMDQELAKKLKILAIKKNTQVYKLLEDAITDYLKKPKALCWWAWLAFKTVLFRGGPHRLDRLGADLRWNTPAIMPPPKAVLISCIRQ